MPAFRGARPLKRWRYVGVFCDELMICAAAVRVGPARQVFWAVLTRQDHRLRERTHTLLRRSSVDLTRGRMRVQDGPVRIDLALAEEAGWETVCAHGAGYVWTRKQAGVRAHGTLTLDGGPPRAVEALAVVDDTAGYHARVTEWHWAAGVGVDPQGRPLAFNLVQGVNDPPTGSERAVWVERAPAQPDRAAASPEEAEPGRLTPHEVGPADLLAHEAAPVRFAPDLSRIEAADGSELRFTPEAERRRRENLLVVRSDYRAPFGTFAGTLPGGIELTHGLGVVEHHRARW